MAETGPDRFFHRRWIKDLIRKLAKSDHLTVIVGAGLSVDHSGPTWGTLVGRLLEDCAEHLHVAEDQRDAFRKQVLDAHSFVSAGSICRAVLADRFDQRLKQRLYPPDATPGGIFAKAVTLGALVWRYTDGDHVLLTTNYDDALLAAFRSEEHREMMGDRDPRDEAQVYTKRDDVEGSVIPIYHLHGYIPREGAPQGDIIFSEADYALLERPPTNTDDAQDWRREIVMQRLEGSNCVFVGASLQDPGVTRYLLESASARRTNADYGCYAAFAAQDDNWRRQPNLRQQLDLASRRRLDHLHVQEIKTNFYGEIALFLNEIRVCRFVGGPTEWDRGYRFGQRLTDRWWTPMHERILNRDEGAVFQDTQQRFHDELSALRDAVYERTDRIRDTRDAGPGEELFSIQLWARNPPEYSLELWGSSESIWTEPHTLLSELIGDESKFEAVRAFCFGAPHVAPPRPDSATRWKYSLHAPVFLPGEPWFNLPVGVITLASTRPEESSCLGSASVEERARIWTLLLKKAQELLKPTAT